jgi:hypothetical protein
MAHFVAEHEGEFVLAVHQREQFARDVNVSAGHREGVAHRRVEQRHPIGRAGIGDIGIARPAADARDVVGQGAFHLAAELLDQLRVLLRRLLQLGRSDRTRRGLGESRRCEAQR